jgi:16S rRNA (adenine1518-N6/adenine1519-N6)-dimethyltransferase
MDSIRAKKQLGQHFLIDENIAESIVDAIFVKQNPAKGNILEIGPGMGVLTKYLLNKQSFLRTQKSNLNFTVVEIDREAVAYLKQHYSDLSIIEGDFLKMDLETKDFLMCGNTEVNNSDTDRTEQSISIIGNFPYNISSQILFKVLENKELILCVVGMFQKEVAVRIASKPGNKDYGILSVLLQAFYDIEYLFSVDEDRFNPPPKVKSGVIRLIRNNVEKLDCDEQNFVKVVKTAFNQRRKTLRNALSVLVSDKQLLADDIFNKRAEQLGVNDFVYICRKLSNR